MSDVQTEQQVETGQQQTETQQGEQQTEQRQQPDTSWVPKRISEITAARRAAEQRAAEAEARLRDQEALIAQLRSGDPAAVTQTPVAPSREEFERLVQARADALVTQRASESTLNQRIAEVNAAGAKDFGEDYEKSVNNLNMAGIGGPDFLRVVTNVPNPEKLVTWLGKPENLNEAMRVATLDPVQMAIEMTKMSTRAAKDLGKQISKAPPPVEGLEGGSSVSDGGMPDPEKDPKGFIAWRNKNARKKR
jgi:hypothetical protein